MAPEALTSKRAVFNTSPIIALADIGILGTVGYLFTDILIPEQVASEVLREPAHSLLAGKLASGSWCSASITNTALFATLRGSLDPGESGAITLATEQDSAVLVIDEWKGRRTAKRLGLHITGTLGILLLAKRHGLIQDLEDAISRLQATGFYINDQVVRTILNG